MTLWIMQHVTAYLNHNHNNMRTIVALKTYDWSPGFQAFITAA